MLSLDISVKRSILLSARFRFSPEVQPIREAATDRIVEQILLLNDGVAALGEGEIVEQAQAGAGNSLSLTLLAVRQSLARLISSNRVDSIRGAFQDSYRLSNLALVELKQIQNEAEDRFRRVVERLFRNAPCHATAYSAVFLECLSSIFASLGEAYVRVLKGESRIWELVGPATIADTIQKVAASRADIDVECLHSALNTFFVEENPDCAAIKWNLAQNYYLAKAIGLDPTGRLLSREVLRDAEFYLDTNVIIPALESRARHRHSVQALGTACRQLNIPLKVCQVSIDQLRNVTQYNVSILPKTAAQIPERTAAMVPSIFFRLYKEELDRVGTVDLDALFAPFFAPMDALRAEFGIELVDDQWFGNPVNRPEVERVARQLNDNLVARKRRPKGTNSALHDSSLALWILRERHAGNQNCWLITLDSSFSDSSWLPDASRPVAITLDALLQWLSPMVQDGNGAFESSYSDAVKYLLLPHENLFELRDFLIFAEMEWQCKELPAEDVEACVKYLKTTLPNIDPSTPSGRERLSHEVTKFFVDPGRKHKTEVARLETEKQELVTGYEQRLAEMAADGERRMLDEAEAKQKQIDALRTQAEAADRANNERILTLERRLNEKQEEDLKSKLRSSAIRRLVASVIIGLALLASVVFFINWFGKGDNLFQKAVGSWAIIALCIGVAIFVGELILGRDRLEALGWPFRKT